MFHEPADALDPGMRIGSRIAQLFVALGVSTKERVAEALDLVDPPRRTLQLYPADPSGGQQRQVGIARAMITRPKQVVLDEPTSVLEPTARVEIIELFVGIQKKLGTANLFISHDLGTVRFISHRIAVMYLGMIVEQGEAANLFAQPRHP
jgi:ABC-type glutathione transport system ATPase component